MDLLLPLRDPGHLQSHGCRLELAHRESSDLAKQLIATTIEKQEVPADQLIIHSDRGPSMTSHSVAHLLGSLGVTRATVVRMYPTTIRFPKASSKR